MSKIITNEIEEQINVEKKSKFGLIEIIIVSIVPILLAIGGLVVDIKGSVSTVQESQRLELEFNKERFAELKIVKTMQDSLQRCHEKLETRVFKIESTLNKRKIN